MQYLWSLLKEKLKENGHCLDVTKYSKSSTLKQPAPISCRCAAHRGKGIKNTYIQVC